MEELIEEILLRLPPPQRNRRTSSALHSSARLGATCSPVASSAATVSSTEPRPCSATYTTLATRPNSSLLHPMPEVSDDDDDIRWVLDCRHGRVLTLDSCYGFGSSIIRFSIWDPITRDITHLMMHAQCPYSYTAAVLYAIDGCDHLDCHGGPFRVVLVSRKLIVNQEYYVAFFSLGMSSISPLIVGGGTPSVLKYDLGSHGLSVIDASGVPLGVVAMKAHDGGLGFVAIAMSGDSLYLISQQASGGWARHKTIELETTILLSKNPHHLFGYADGTDTIFVSTNAGLFTLNLKSRQVRKVAEIDGCYRVVPYTSFFTPGTSFKYLCLSSLLR
ncbi:hypothetical protein BS78_02G019100 [Paspalum vaginatum]|nr:hypothetical protein BS78_02G019100 [Paspalum vaginatum]